MVGGAAVTEEFHPGFKVSTRGPRRGPAARVAGGGARPGRARPAARSSPSRGCSRRCPTGAACACGATPSAPRPRSTASRPRDAERYPEFHRTPERGLRRPPRAHARADAARHRPAADGADLSGSVGLGLGFRGLGRGGRAAACCAGARWRWPTSPRSGSRPRPAARPRLRARHLRDVRRPLVGGHHRQPAPAGRGVRRQRRGLRGAGARRPGRAHATRWPPPRARTARRCAPARRSSASSRADGRAAGVVARGRRGDRRARRSSPARIPQRTFLGLLDPAAARPDDVQRLRNYRQEGMASKVNLALAGLPAFTAAQGEDPARRCSAAASTSARTWTTSSARSTTPSTAASRGGRTSTSRSRR